MKPHPRSDALAARSRQVTPGGVHSNVRIAGSHTFLERGVGAWLYDVDGNDYVDHLLGQGPNFLGHANSAVTTAVMSAASRGGALGGQHDLEVAAAEIFLDSVAWAERVRFGLSGTEADQAALRIARAATGKTKFIRFVGTYHGWLDNVLVDYSDGEGRVASRGQLATHLLDTYFVPFNSAEGVRETLRQHSDIAAILVEPVMCNSAAITPQNDFLLVLRELCDEHGVVLIFDEVITGFRLALGGAAEYYGVTPDLAVYGKAIAGGWPVSALAGSAELMDSLTAGVNHSGTFNSSLPACAAVYAALSQLRGDPPYDRIDAYGSALMAYIVAIGEEYGVPLRVQGLPAAFHVSFGPQKEVIEHSQISSFDLSSYAEFTRDLVEAGIWVAPRGIWYVSAVHGDQELEAVKLRFRNAVEAFVGRTSA